MANCSHDCENCELKGNCSDEIVKSKPNDASKIKRVIGVLSGKGGVGVNGEGDVAVLWFLS